MHHPKLVLVALVGLLLGAWLATPGYAAELAGPISSTTPSSCSPDAAIFSLPAPLVSTESTQVTTAVVTCGCGDAICVGKPINSHCGTVRFCQDIGVCSIVTPVRKCGCLPPP
jgi:hypothetical protein